MVVEPRSPEISSTPSHKTIPIYLLSSALLCPLSLVPPLLLLLISSWSNCSSCSSSSSSLSSPLPPPPPLPRLPPPPPPSPLPPIPYSSSSRAGRGGRGGGGRGGGGARAGGGAHWAVPETSVSAPDRRHWPEATTTQLSEPLDPSWSGLGANLGRLGWPLGRLGAHLGWLRGLLGTSWAFNDLASWSPLGNALGDPEGHLGAFLERLGAILECLGRLGAFFRRLGSSPGAILERTWAARASPWAVCRPLGLA